MILKLVLVVTLSVFGQNIAYALDNEQQNEMVRAHNKYRATVGTSALSWSATLAATAQTYADRVKATQNCGLVHSKAAGLGENLYWASAIAYSNGSSEIQTITSGRVVDSWAGEKANYAYGTNSCAPGKACGHYTQVVWKNTTQLGCGRAICNDKSQVWVCNYLPAGNYVGQKPY